MNIVNHIIVFFVAWWLSLFLVLPFGIKTHNESDEKYTKGIDMGSPIHANMKRKMLITTAFACLVSFCFWIVNYYDLISIR